MNVIGLLLTTSLIILPVTALAQARQWNAECAVFRGDRLIEKNQCQQTIIKDGSGVEEGSTHIISYQWKSGGKTVTENEEESFRINGKQGKIVNTQEGYGLCVKNLTSGNIFCSKLN